MGYGIWKEVWVDKAPEPSALRFGGVRPDAVSLERNETTRLYATEASFPAVEIHKNVHGFSLWSCFFAVPASRLSLRTMLKARREPVLSLPKGTCSSRPTGYNVALYSTELSLILTSSFEGGPTRA